ncbi:hypothetical protein AC249_AIPGENE12530 [Exaiptasia diaphana]|nr:hypothetical protein AC249_AIPGENE12530 [Exaiptasia diaphana]
MERKRRFCGHCDEYVTQRTFRHHFSLYYDEKRGGWQRERSNQCSSDDESSDDVEATRSKKNLPRCDSSSDLPNNDQEYTGGALTDDLEDDNIELTDGHQNDDEWMYMERPLFESIPEVWSLDEDELNRDFTTMGHDHDRSLYHDVREDHSMQIIKWMMIFLCMWSSYCCISDNAMEILISFIGAVFSSLGSLFPALASVALLFPKSFNLLKQKLGLTKDQFVKFVVCPKCETLYEFDDCYEERLGQTVIKTCQYVNHGNHRQVFRRTVCNELLLKEVILKNGRKRLYPFKVFCYNSVIDSLKKLLSKANFISNCEQWRNRNVPQGFLADIFDGKVWSDFLYVDGQPFLAARHNYAFMLNVDWFQPFKHSLYSVAALYMVFMNLPRELRFKPENIILVGVIPGPHEPMLSINTYLKPLVAELNTLWQGIQFKTVASNGILTIRAALLCVGCDVPAARKVCGFTGHSSCKGCSKCKKAFTGNVSDRMDYSGFDPCNSRTNKEHRQQAQDILNQTTATDKAAKEKEHGTRFTELMMLPYFDCVRFHIIDPMHNLFTGTAKHMMKNVWLDESSQVIDRKKLEKIQKKIDQRSIKCWSFAKKNCK